MAKDKKRRWNVRVVVDIVFSAMLNTDGRIGSIILQPKSKLNFFSTKTLVQEIEKHADKLMEISGYSQEQFKRVLLLLTARIKFIAIRLIPPKLFEKSLRLTENVDVDDNEFVALTEHVKGKLWSGDKKHISGLEAKGWHKFTSVEELLKLTKSRSL